MMVLAIIGSIAMFGVLLATSAMPLCKYFGQIQPIFIFAWVGCLIAYWFDFFDLVYPTMALLAFCSYTSFVRWRWVTSNRRVKINNP